MTLAYFSSLETVINNAQISAGQRNVSNSISIGGQKVDVSDAIVNASGDDFNSQVLWTSGDGGLATFDILWFESDQPVILEFRNSNGSPAFAIISVPANTPLVLGADDLVVGQLGADGSATAVADVIDRITVKNNVTGASTTVTANVRLLLFD